MLTLADIAKAYGTRILFSGVTAQIQRSDRLGLVGANGAGKSTLFSLLLREDAPDSGSISWERGATVGHLPQETAPVGDETVIDIATGLTPEFVEIRHRLREAERGEGDSHHDFSELHARYEQLGGYTVEPKAKRILGGLGFRTADFDRPARTFSGGWVMRAYLARLLVREPDLLMLDEPTNHLDLQALLWLQNYLTGYPGAILLISHDRSFLNGIVNGIFELRQGQLFRYRGNYDDYLVQKAAQEEQQQAAFKNQRREIARLQRFVDRFGAKATKAAQAKSKEKQIERMERIEAPESSSRQVRFRFPQPPRSGLKVIALQGVRQAYGDNVVYQDLNFEAERNQRIVLVGPNGAGKSTLLKILADAIPIQGGTRELGHNVRAGYYAQYRLDQLNPGRTVLEEALDARPDPMAVPDSTVRTLLGSFLFTGDDVFKKISVLSGGEKSRLALLKLLLDPPNLLLMDEPTTHLDIPSIDALLEALQQFQGTLIFISHDVHFIRSLADQVLHVDAGRLTRYAGNYDYFLDKSGAANAQSALAPSLPSSMESAPASRADSAAAAPRYKTKEERRAEAEARNARSAEKRAIQKEIAALEQDIIRLEAEQARLTAALEDAGTYAEPGRAAELNRQLAAVVARLQQTTTRWEAAGAKLES